MQEEVGLDSYNMQVQRFLEEQYRLVAHRAQVRSQDNRSGNDGDGSGLTINSIAETVSTSLLTTRGLAITPESIVKWVYFDWPNRKLAEWLQRAGQLYDRQAPRHREEPDPARPRRRPSPQ